MNYDSSHRQELPPLFWYLVSCFNSRSLLLRKTCIGESSPVAPEPSVYTVPGFVSEFLYLVNKDSESKNEWKQGGTHDSITSNERWNC